MGGASATQQRRGDIAVGPRGVLAGEGDDLGLDQAVCDGPLRQVNAARQRPPASEERDSRASKARRCIRGVYQIGEV